MPIYHYKGYDKNGLAVTGEMVVADLDDLEQRLQSRQVTLVLAKATKNRGGNSLPGSSSGSGQSSHRKKRAISDKAASALLDNLATMAKAGVPFVDSLDAIVATSADPVIIKGVQNIRDQIVGGTKLSDAMANATELFPEMVSDMVRVAEDGGHLDTALAAAGGYLERSADLRRKISNAMMYPAVMLVVSGFTVMSLVIFVLPRFAEIFTKMHVKLPLSTRLMFSLGGFVHAQPAAFVVILVLLLTGLVLLIKSERGRIVIGRVAMKVPKLGDLLRSLAVSRALQSISTLLSSNVSLVEALNHGAKVAGNADIKQGLQKCVSTIEGGGTLAQACADTKVFPPMLIQIVGIGERTGQLGPMLSTYGERMEMDSDAQLKSLVALLEPILIAFMGLIVGTIAVSIISPIYSTIQNVK